MLAALAVVAIVAVLPVSVLREPRSTASGSEGVVLPATLDPPLFWQATIDADPNGPVKLLFMHENNAGFEGGPVFIGTDDSYRGLLGSPSDDVGGVSPDGRYVVHFHGHYWELLDTITGRSRSLEVSTPFHRFLGWSPDGSRFLFLIDRSEHGTRYDADNQPIENAVALDDFVLYDVPGGEKTHLFSAAADDAAGGFSPDGKHVAFTTGQGHGPQTLHIMDLATRTELKKIALTGQQRLLGPEPWTPDGRRLALAMTLSCPRYPCEVQDPPGTGRWRLQYANVATGEITDDPLVRQEFPTALAGWRDGGPVVAGLSKLLWLRADGGTETLLTLPQGGYAPLVPREMIERASFGGPEISPSILPAQTWAYLCLPAIFAPVAAVVAVIVVRRRRRRLA